MSESTLDVLIPIGRAASGKSEMIDFFARIPDDVRQTRCHIADPDVIDDFPILWTCSRRITSFTDRRRSLNLAGR